MRKLSIIVISLMLSGCHLIDGTGGTGTTPTPPTTSPGTGTTPPDEPITPIPVPKKPNWTASLEHAVEKLAQGKPIDQQELVLVDDVKNSSDIEVNTRSLTSELMQLMRSTKRFSIVPDAELTAAKETLGLADEDSLNTRSKTIGLARHLTAPYILYTSVEGSGPENLNVFSQVMQVQTGELVWSAKSNVVVE